MNTKHTPGPWFATNRVIVARPVRISEHFAITPVGGPTLAFLPHGARDTQEANARLIAQSPLMAKALAEAAEFLRNGTPIHPGSHVAESIMQAAILAGVSP